MLVFDIWVFNAKFRLFRAFGLYDDLLGVFQL